MTWFNLGLLILLIGSSKTCALEFTEYECNEGDGASNTGADYTITDSSNHLIPCRVISDLTLPMAVDYVIDIELNVINKTAPSIMINVHGDNSYDMIIFRTGEGWTAEKASMNDGQLSPPVGYYGPGLPAGAWFYVKMKIETGLVRVIVNSNQNFTIPLSSQLNPSVGLMHTPTYKTECQPDCELEFRNIKLTPVTTPQVHTGESGSLTPNQRAQNTLYWHTLDFSNHIQGKYCFVAFYFKDIDIGPGTIFIENDNSFDVDSVQIYSTIANKMDVYYYTSNILFEHTGYTIDYDVFACDIPSSDLEFICESGNYQDRHADFFRSISYETDLTNSDVDLPMGWYRFTSCAGQTMPNTRPGVEGVCGTQRPIWLQEPTGGIDKSGLSKATACLSSTAGECVNSWMIPVYRCGSGSFYLYYFVPSPASSGYCVGKRTQCDAAQNLTSIDGSGCDPCAEGDFPSLNEVPSLGSWQPNAAEPGAFTLSCAIHEPVGATVNIEYQAEWYIDFGTHRARLIHQEGDTSKVTHLSSKQIRKEHLQNHIICQARGKYEGGLLWGPWAESSPLFIGIQVLNEKQDISTTLSSTVDFNITVPFSCDGDNCMDVNDENCYMEVYTLYETSRLSPLWHCKNKLYLEPVFVNVDGCSAIVKCSEWGTKVSKHRIIQKESSTTLTQHSQTLYVVTKDTRYTWNNLVIDTQINMILEGKEGILQKTCTSRNDPHITTYRGVMYDAHTRGEYVLYKSKPTAEQDMEVLVTATFEPCATNIMCNRALGVRVKNEVVIIDPTAVPTHKYHGPGFGEDGFKITPINNFKTYKIYFPRGEVISAIIRGQFMNIEILGNTEEQHYYTRDGNGLCGKLFQSHSVNDLNLRKGQTHRLPSRRWENLPTFYSDWRADPELKEDIITRPYEGPSSKPTDPVYSCSVDNLSEFLLAEEWTFSTDLLKEECKPYSNDNFMDELRSSVNSASVKQHDKNVANVFKKSIHDKQSVYSKSEWTEESAQQYCVSYIAESSTGKACSDIVSQKVDQAVSECAVDILLTGSTEWAVGTLESLLDLCTEAVYRNISLWVAENDEGNDTTITTPALIDNLCPSDCSGNGACLERTCVCNEGFVNYDCSLSVETPPGLDGIHDGAICYTSTCNSISIIGDKFINSDTLTCHYVTEHTILSESGSMISHNLITCSLPATVSSTKGFTKYSVLVSNDGEHMGESLGLVLVNSPCLTCEETQDFDVTCHVKNNMCLIGGQCVPSGEVAAEDVCSFCNPEVDQDAWTLQQGCGDTGANPGLQPLHIGLIAVGSVLVAIGLIVGSIAIAKGSQRKVKP